MLFRSLRGVIDDALQTVHRKAVELRELDDELGELPILIEQHVTDFSQRTGLSVELSGTTCLGRVPAIYKLLCLKILQEALTNVAKHASATRVWVRIREEPREIHITMTDDGRGIDTDARGKPDSLGLLGLHERLTAIGGSFTVSNATPHGAQIEARVPTE